MNKIRSQKYTLDLVLCATGSALIALGAFLRIPIPVIPFTMQVFFVVLFGLIAGAKRALISMLIYIFIGLVGIPIFANGGGIMYVFQPTFGYLIGMCIGACLCGYLFSKQKPTFVNALWCSLVCVAIIYAVGLVYLYLVKNFYLNTPMSVTSVLYYGFLVTIAGDLFCVLVVCYSVSALLKIPYVNNLLGNNNPKWKTVLKTSKPKENLDKHIKEEPTNIN